MLFFAFSAVVLAATASATKLYVSSYSGNITILDLLHSKDTYQLKYVDSNNGCAPAASWLRFDSKNSNMYCVDEGTATSSGSLNSFKLDKKTGSLARVLRLPTLKAPVNSAIYTSPNGTQVLAVAHYTSGFSTFKLDPATGSFSRLQAWNFTLAKPGPNAARQAGSHPHQVIVDPQKKYFVIPDLGGDLVRIFYIDPTTLKVSPRKSISVVPGSGPRHGQFHVHQGQQTFYYLVTEIDSKLTSYNVQYLPKNGGLEMKAVSQSTTYGPNHRSSFTGNAAAEIYIAPDAKSLLVSNRNATFFNITNPDPKNKTSVASDTMALFTLPGAGNGTMAFDELTPAGGSFPRSFSVSPDGSLVAIGLQNSGRVVIYSRCAKSGRLGREVLADFEGLGQVTSIVWNL